MSPTPEQRRTSAAMVLKNRRIRDLENTVANLQQEKAVLQRRLAQWIDAFGEDGVEIVNGLKGLGEQVRHAVQLTEAQSSAILAGSKLTQAGLDAISADLHGDWDDEVEVSWGEDYITGMGQRLRVHAREHCDAVDTDNDSGGEQVWCVIHRRMPGPQSTWPTNWRGQWREMEIICPHSVGHPAPEQMTRHGVVDGHGCCHEECCNVYRT